jgi:hypothetical protein
VLPLKGLVTSPADRPVREFMEDADVRVAPRKTRKKSPDSSSATTWRACRW